MSKLTFKVLKCVLCEHLNPYMRAKSQYYDINYYLNCGFQKEENKSTSLNLVLPSSAYQTMHFNRIFWLFASRNILSYLILVSNIIGILILKVHI